MRVGESESERARDIYHQFKKATKFGVWNDFHSICERVPLDHCTDSKVHNKSHKNMIRKTNPGLNLALASLEKN